MLESKKSLTQQLNGVGPLKVALQKFYFKFPLDSSDFKTAIDTLLDEYSENSEQRLFLEKYSKRRQRLIALFDKHGLKTMNALKTVTKAPEGEMNRTYQIGQNKRYLYLVEINPQNLNLKKSILQVYQYWRDLDEKHTSNAGFSYSFLGEGLFNDLSFSVVSARETETMNLHTKGLRHLFFPNTPEFYKDFLLVEEQNKAD